VGKLILTKCAAFGAANFGKSIFFFCFLQSHSDKGQGGFFNFFSEVDILTLLKLSFSQSKAQIQPLDQTAL